MTWDITIDQRIRSKKNTHRIMKAGKKRFLANDPKTTRAEESLRSSLPSHPEWPLSGPVRVDVVFSFRIPKTGPNRTRSPGEWYEGKPDRTNALSMLEDAMEGVVYNDDSQVVAGSVGKIWDDRDRIHIRVSIPDSYEDPAEEERRRRREDADMYTECLRLMSKETLSLKERLRLLEEGGGTVDGG